MRFRLLSSLFLTAALPLVIGCGISANVPIADQPSAAIAGRAMGGQQPVAGATVSVWSMGTSGYGTGAVQLASTLSDAGGNFQFAANAYTCPFANTPVYLLASGGNPGLAAGTTNANLVLGAALGTCAAAKSEFAIVNEVTTAALAFSLGQFFPTTVGGAYTTDVFGGTCTGCAAGTYNVGLVAASNNTYPVLVSNAAGQVNPSTATTKIESAKIYTIANILAACVNTSGQTSTTETTTSCGQLFNFTKPATGTRPLDTLQAAVQMSRIPYQNVTALYNLSTATPPFGGGLASAPNDWTVAIAYTSAAFGLGINLDGTSGAGTSSSIDIDTTGRVWFPSNTTLSHGVGYFDPASSSFNGPFATGLTHPQYLTIDTRSPANVFATDISSGALISTSTTLPAALGTPYSVASSTSGGPLIVDAHNTVIFAYSTSATVHSAGLVTFGGTPSVIRASATQGTATGLVTANDTATPSSLFYATTSSATRCADEDFNSAIQNLHARVSSGVCASGGMVLSNSIVFGNPDIAITFVASTVNQLGDDSAGYSTAPVTLTAPEAIAFDGSGALWFANSGNSSVSTLAVYADDYFLNTGTQYSRISPVAYLHDSTHGATMTTPYGLGIDRSGNVWVSNAGCISTSTTPCIPGSFVLTQLVGAAAPRLTPLAAIAPTAVATRPAN